MHEAIAIITTTATDASFNTIPINEEKTPVEEEKKTIIMYLIRPESRHFGDDST